MTQGYRDLIVWQQAMDVAVETYRLTSAFPKDEILGIALGSKSELETQIVLSERVNLLKSSETESIKKSLDDIGKMLTALRRKLGTKDWT